jgi:hypothetical protein
MAWPDFVEAADKNRGTFIVERYSLKGPVRWWWTSEDLYSLSPYPTVDWLTLVRDKNFNPFLEWCRREYTSPDEGHGLLVDVGHLSKDEHDSFMSRLNADSGDLRWIEVAPPARKR